MTSAPASEVRLRLRLVMLRLWGWTWEERAAGVEWDSARGHVHLSSRSTLVSSLNVSAW